MKLEKTYYTRLINRSTYRSDTNTILLYGLYPLSAYEVDCDRYSLQEWRKHLRTTKKDYNSEVDAKLVELWTANVGTK